MRGRRPPGRAGLDGHGPRHPYVICDTDGVPVTPQQAKASIIQQWTVPEEVRRQGVTVKKQSANIVLAISLTAPPPKDARSTGRRQTTSEVPREADCAPRPWRMLVMLK